MKTLALLLALTFAVVAEENPNTNEIKTTLNRLGTDWNSRDVDGLTSLFTENGSHVTSTGRSIEGSESLRKAYREAFANPRYKSSITKIVDIVITHVSPDVAYADVTWKNAHLKDDEGLELPERNGRSIAVLVKQQGGWRIRALRSMRPHSN